MKRRDVRLFLWDIDDACNVIEDLTAGKSLQDYSQNVASRFAIERAFEIIGEAMRNVMEQRPEFAARFTNPAYVISFRNRIAHEYWGILSDIIWTTIHDHLPILRREVNALLRELPPPEDGDLPA